METKTNKNFVRQVKKSLSLILSAAMVVTGLNLGALPTVSVNAAETKDVTYDFSSMKVVDGYQSTADIADGELSIHFDQQYAERMISIPEEVDPATIKAITVNVKEGNPGDLAVKVRTAEKEVGVSYGNPTIGDLEGKTFDRIGLMSLPKDSATDFVFESVTFTIGKKVVADVPAGKVTIAAKDLELLGLYSEDNVSVDTTETGIVVNISAQYDEARFVIPEEIAHRVEGVTVNGDDNYGSMSVKMLFADDKANTDKEQFEVAYGSNSVAKKNPGLTPIKYFGVMSLTGEAVSFPIESVTLTLNDGVAAPAVSTRVIDEKVNMIKGFNGACESKDWWNDADWCGNHIVAVPYGADEEKASKDAGTSYVSVNSIEAWGSVKAEANLKGSNIYEAFAPGAYEYTFYAKTVSDNDVDVTMKVISTKTVDGQDTYPEIKTELDGAFKVSSDKWTKVSGTFAISEEDYNSFRELGFCITSPKDFYLDDVKVTSVVERDIPSLYKVVKENSPTIERMGVALPISAFSNPATLELAFKHFNSVSCENEMKPESLLGGSATLGEDGWPVLTYTNADTMCDAITAYNAKNGTDIKMRGHVFVWHSQFPGWFFKEGFSSNGAYVDTDTMNTRLEWYIKTVATHFDTKYPGLIYAWDVVNEAANDAGGTRQNGDWFNVYGKENKQSIEYILKAFEYADKYVAEDTILFYNDYNDCTPSKRDTICGFLDEIKKVVKPGRKIGAGMQGHHDMATPSAEMVQAAVDMYSEHADVVHVTELDVKSTMGFDGTDLEAEFVANGHRYKELYDIFASSPKMQCITIWGSHDSVSWLKTSNSVGGSADGKTPQYPLLFDDNYKAKPAYWAFVDASTLPPSVKQITALETDEFASAQTVSFKAGDAKVTLAPIWGKDGVKLEVTVLDSNITAEDEVTVYVSDEKKATTKKATDAESIEGGYKVAVDLTSSASAFETVLFDVVVTNGAEKTAFNDYTLSQATSAKYYAKINTKPYMTIAKGTASVDADPADWKDIPATELTIKPATIEASATAKVCWDEDALYVLYEVKDPTLDKSSVQVHEQDSTETFIDELNEKAGGFDDNDKQYRVNFENEASFNGTTCTADNLVSATKKTADGYIVEAAFKWTSLKAAAGKEIGLDLQINDGKGGTRIGTANWFDASGNGWQNPGVYGTAKLVDSEVTEDMKAAAKAVDDQVAAIGDVTLAAASVKKVEDARAAYSQLSVIAKTAVKAESVDTLAKAEKKVEDLKAADEVSKLIAAIGTVTKDSKAAIDKAKAALAKLTADQKALVPAADTNKLAAAEKAYADVTKPAPSTKPSVAPSTTPATPVVKVGDKEVVSGVTYVVTSATEAEYVAVADKGTVTIPDTVTIKGKKFNVTSIAKNAFKNKKKLKKVTIGKNIKKIGSKAFYGCKNLKKIVVKTTKLTKKKVGSKAFAKINAKAKFKVPAKKVKAYKAIVKAKGAKTAKVTK